MKEVSTLSGQTLLDLTVQETGDIERLFEMAVENDQPITFLPDAGSSVVVGEAETEKRSTVQLFSTTHKPASGVSDSDILPAGEGIGFWFIGNDFIVQ